MEKRLASRREFLNRAAYATEGLVALSLAACAPQTPPRPKSIEKKAPSPQPPERFNEIDSPRARQLFFEAIQNLPESPTKAVIERYTIPLYTDPYPGSILLGGVVFKHTGSDVGIEYLNIPAPDKAARFPGIYGYRGNAVNAPLPYFVQRDTEVVIPYISLMRAEEKQRVPSGFSLHPDGTPVILTEMKEKDVSGKNYQTYFEGISYAIRIIRTPNQLSDALTESLETYVWVKGALMIALQNIWLQETAKKLKEYGLPTEVAAIQNGRQTQTEFLSEALYRFNKQKGRFAVVLDNAAASLALKALENTEAYQNLEQGTELRSVIAAVKQLDFGTTSESQFYRSFESALSLPALQTPRVSPEFSPNIFP
ncbi:hypothetical protein HY358_01570 [Candidatus Roizmanbacteria bacterium]|nr:hypothetical protein [Candidatus Roizmanbacteria bacterium]